MGIVSAVKLLNFHKKNKENQISQNEKNFEKLMETIEAQFKKHVKRVESGKDNFGTFDVNCFIINNDMMSGLLHSCRKQQLLDYLNNNYSNVGYKFIEIHYYPGMSGFSHSAAKEYLSINYQIDENYHEESNLFIC